MSKNPEAFNILGRSILSFALASLAATAVGSLSCPANAGINTIKVGTISGEDEDVWRVVAAEAAKADLKIETVVFNDYTQPNEAIGQSIVDLKATGQSLPMRWPRSDRWGETRPC